jgi:D-alanyl-D-alanine dipeptidase
MCLNIPNDFVDLNDYNPQILTKSRYYSKENFTGSQVIGYENNQILCTEQAAAALSKAHAEFMSYGYNIVVYDAYRPVRAVNYFVKWTQNDKNNIAKELYYPDIDKKNALELHYLSPNSTHSRGSTIDLTIIKQGKKLHDIKLSARKMGEWRVPFLDDGTLDMGSSFDLFSPISHHDCKFIDEKYLERRNFLRKVMKKFGFIDHPQEWWHYRLMKEPYTDTYFDFIT